MNSFTLALTAVKTFLDMVRTCIETLDLAIPESGQGQVKLNILKGWVDNAIAAEARFAPVASLVWTLLTPLIAGIVAARKTKTPGA